MVRAIINGAAGFVGSAVAKELAANGVELWAIVRPGFSKGLSSSRLNGVPVHIIECSLDNMAGLPAMIGERGFDVWYQFAWDGLRGDKLVDYHAQLLNVEYVLDSICVAAELGCRKFVGSGSISQYELQAEEDKLDAGDKHRVYKTAKLACEYMGRSVAASKGIEFIWPIITNIYGVGESSPRLINSMIRNLRQGRHQALSEGNQIYDFIYISDAARAFRLIGEAGRENRRYVIASGSARPLKEFLCELRDVVAPDAELGFGEMEFNGIYMPKESYSTEELVEDTGFSPELSFSEGISLTSEWIQSVEEN